MGGLSGRSLPSGGTTVTSDIVSSGQDTYDIYRNPDGSWTEERQALHEKIINDYIKDGTTADESDYELTAYYLGGGSASGKSTIRSSTIEPMLKKMNLNPVVVDSDEIKKALPEFAPFIKFNANTAASRVHEESSYLTNLIIDRLIAQKKFFIYDGTLSNIKKYSALTVRLKNNGYKVTAYITDVPVANAFKWGQQRAERTGRTVPREIIVNSHKNVYNTFEAISSDLSDYYVFRNPNLTGGSHTLVASKSAGVVDNSQYAAFKNKEFEELN